MKTQKNKKHNPALKQSNKVDNNKTAFFIISLLALTAIVYFNVLKHDFTNWDDDIYLFGNNYIKDLSQKGIYNIFSNSFFGNYHPLTTLTYALEFKLFGLNPVYFHLTNYILHLVNSLLVFLLIRKFSKNTEIPFITALLFAIHPMHVESVAWVSETKDVLYSFFFLASLIFYVNYIKTAYENYKYYIIAFILFLLSLLSKSAAVTLPVTMLLCVYFLNKKIVIKDILLSIPFLIFSVIFGIIALNTQQVTLSDTNIIYSNINRLLIVIYAVYFYIIRFIFPYNFSTFHQLPKLSDNLLPLEYYMAPFIIIALIIFVVVSKKDLKQILIFGLLFFIVNIALVIQIIPVGQANVSERYTYIPYIGLSFIAAYSFIKLKETKNNVMIKAAGILFLGFLTISTWVQNNVWANSITLWTKAIEVNPENSVAYNHRGSALIKLKNYKDALEDYNKAIDINNKFADAYNNRGLAKFYLGNNTDAVSDFNKAIEINPKYTEAYFNRGNSKNKLEKYQEALEDFNKAIELNNSYLDAYINRGNIKGVLGDKNGALADFTKATEINSEYPIAFYSRGFAKSNLNLYSEAIEDYNIALRLDSKFALAYLNRGNAYYFLSKMNEACIDWKTASSLGENRGQLNSDQYCK